MSYRPNRSQQLSLTDSFLNLSERSKKALLRTWARYFSEDLFPKIDEDIFAVLYSNKPSRPSTPVNVIIGALIIKEMFDYSDDEMVDMLMIQPAMQYALHTTSFEEQPLSDKTLSRFRKRCYKYEEETGIDLIHECMVSLSQEIAKVMEISGRTKRMDSMMIDSNIRVLNRMELIYKCIANLVKYMTKTNDKLVPSSLQHYTDANDFNKVIYHSKSSDNKSRINSLLEDADILYAICEGKDEIQESKEYLLFNRCMTEQTLIDKGSRRLCDKNDNTMNSNMLQSPSDPEATYRFKAGKKHRGYVANLEESVGKGCSVITDYQYEQNIYSDSQFLKDNIDRSERKDKESVVVTDGAYYSEDNEKLAKEKNIKLISTDLVGRETPDIYADFEFNEDGTVIIKCPSGHTPNRCSYDKKTEKCRASFDYDKCADCPHKDICKPRMGKKSAVVSVSLKQKNRALTQRYFKTDEFKNYSRLRNGVETIPSILRRVFHTEKTPRGLQRGRFFLGMKIGALNFKKFMRFLEGKGNYAQNPVIV